MQKQTKFLSGDRELFESYTLKRQKVIGRGNSYVYEVEDNNGNIECVKEVRLEDNMSEFIFRKEIELLAKLKLKPHPNIVEFRGSYCIQQKNQFRSRKGYIQMEKGLTNLKQFLEHRKDKQSFFQQEEVLSFITSMLDAFTHLQKIELAHRDVKPSNILIFQEDPLFMKICDVGAGTAVGISDMTENRTVIGTPYYLSPELFMAYRQKQHLTNYKVYKSDCYSLGLVFLEFCTLQRISNRLQHEKETIEASILELKKRYPNIVGIGKVLRRMLDENVKTRYDFVELQAYINQNDLLRNVKSILIKKINSQVKLDAELTKKLVSTRELLIQKFEDLPNLLKIISSGNKAPIIRINLSTSDGTIKKKQKQLIEQLKNLKHIQLEQIDLSMEMCEIQQNEAEIIARGLFKNSTLKRTRINLWNNKIKSEGLAKIMGAVQTVLPSLTELHLMVPNNSIKLGPSSEQLFDFKQASHLDEFRLNLGFNEIAADLFQPILRGISMAQHLRVLEIGLERTKLNHVHFNKGIKELQNLGHLTELYINASDNSIRDEGVFGICDSIGALSQLQELSLVLRNAEISDKGLHELTKSLQQATNLTSFKINLIGNLLTSGNFKMASLQTLRGLTCIDMNLSNNKIGDMGMKNLSLGLIGIPNLSRLKLVLDGVDVGEKGCLYLGRIISQSLQLAELELSVRYNMISLRGVQCICTGMLSTKKLRRLKLVFEGTKIGDYAANYLATCLLKIRSLASVDLNMENCDLGEPTMENIAKLVRECSKKAEQITISMRKNKEIRMELYQQIKKELNNSRIAIRVDHPPDAVDLSQAS